MGKNIYPVKIDIVRLIETAIIKAGVAPPDVNPPRRGQGPQWDKLSNLSYRRKNIIPGAIFYFKTTVSEQNIEVPRRLF